MDNITVNNAPPKIIDFHDVFIELTLKHKLKKLVVMKYNIIDIPICIINSLKN